MRSILRILDTCKRSLGNRYKSTFSFTTNKFNAVHVNEKQLKETLKSNESLEASFFEETLKNSLSEWNNEKRTSSWFYVPLQLSSFIPILAKYGFKYHHAEYDLAVLNKWLADGESRIPRYATHQVGVGGFVYNKEKNEVLVIKDRHMIKSVWKLPGGSNDLGENIEDTAEREVFEETGIKSKFCSILAFRQQHEYPGAFGRSDFYFICRLEPETFEIKRCEREIEICEWKNLDMLCEYKENMLLNRVARLISYAKRNNYDFSMIDMSLLKIKSIIVPDRFFNFYHRKL